MDQLEGGTSRCSLCVWWDSDGGGGGDYRTQATRVNRAWRQINTGRCTHFLAAAPADPPGGDDQRSA